MIQKKPIPSRRSLPRVVPLVALASVSALGAVCAAWFLGGVGVIPEQPLIEDTEIEMVPERFASVLYPEKTQAAPDTKDTASPGRSTMMKPASKVANAETTKSQLDAEIAESAGVLGAMVDGGELDAAFGSYASNAELLGGIGGLIGAKGVQFGSSGLGSRGTGMGGGGTASGLGTLAVDGQAELRPRTAEEDVRERAQRNVAVEQEVLEQSVLLKLIGTRGESGALHGALGSEDYTDYGLNEMTLSGRDGMSTFSIDVDTASYAICRRKLESGFMPPPSAVRVEEFVNYFPYDYTAPRNGRPFSVHMEAAPNPYQPGHHLLRVGVKGREIDQTHRAPVRLTFLVDVSGSMSSSDKLGLAQEALHFLVGQLGMEDSVAIATYAGRVERVLEPTPTTRRSRIHAAIDSLSSGGSTAMNSGIDLAYDMATEAYVKGAENRVVVLSDGDANVGPSSHTQILETIQQHAGQGISLSTIGFGMGNYKDTLMEQLANRGDGNYHYVDGMDEAEKVFGRDLTGTIQTIARDVKIQVEFDPDVVLAYRLVGYENRDIADRDFRNDAVDAGEVGSGHRVTALYDVVLADGAVDSLATVRLRAKPPGEDAPAAEWSSPFPRRALHASFLDASRDFRIATGAAGFAEKLRNSRYLEEVSYRDVAAIVRDALRPSHDEDGELLELVGQAAELVGEGRVAVR